MYWKCLRIFAFYLCSAETSCLNDYTTLYSNLKRDFPCFSFTCVMACIFSGFFLFITKHSLKPESHVFEHKTESASVKLNKKNKSFSCIKTQFFNFFLFFLLLFHIFSAVQKQLYVFSCFWNKHNATWSWNFSLQLQNARERRKANKSLLYGTRSLLTLNIFSILDACTLSSLRLVCKFTEARLKLLFMQVWNMKYKSNFQRVFSALS